MVKYRTILISALLFATGACGEPDAEPEGQAAAPTVRPQDLYEDLGSEDSTRRHAAVVALGEMAREEPEAVDVLVTLLANQDQTLAAEARRALRRAGLAVLPDLIEALENPLPSVRSGALLVITNHGPAAAEAADEVAALLARDPEWSVRYRAAEALGAMGAAASASIPALERATNDPDPNVRRAAEEALGKVRPDSPAM